MIWWEITLCGSTKFKDDFIREQKRLTLEENIVISLCLFGHTGDNEVLDHGVKEMLDDMKKLLQNIKILVDKIELNNNFKEFPKFNT